MKYFLIEIEKPHSEGREYQTELQRRIAQCEFEVVAVCNSKDEANKENSKFIIQNIKNQSRKHYEIIEGDGSIGLSALNKKVESFYAKIKS